MKMVLDYFRQKIGCEKHGEYGAGLSFKEAAVQCSAVRSQNCE